jgi:hypothetical protein
MNDNDVPDMPDRLEIKKTADDYAKLRELSKTSDITHRIRCLVGSCPPGMECCHWDDDKANNNVWNLRWASRSANIKDCVRNGSHDMARRAHCARGHAYSPENTRIRKSGGRRCVTCVREDCRRRHARRWPPFKEAG